MEMLKRLWNDEEGQGLVEYALIIALISIVIIAFGSQVGDAIKAVFADITGELNSATD